MEKNREIKFRAWDKLNNKMIYPKLMLGFGIKDIFLESKGYNGHTLYNSDVHFMDNLILQQFTGLLDKNGKEIFCGDVFDIGQTVNGCSKFVIVDCIGGYDVRYAFDLEYKYQYDIKELLSIEEIEIIGNIYEPHQ